MTTLVGRTGGALAGAARDARSAWTHRHTAAVALVALAALLPAVAPSWVHVDSMANNFYLALAATGLWLTVALGGMPSLGQGAFMAHSLGGRRADRVDRGLCRAAAQPLRAGDQ